MLENKLIVIEGEVNDSSFFSGYVSGILDHLPDCSCRFGAFYAFNARDDVGSRFSPGCFIFSLVHFIVNLFNDPILFLYIHVE